MTLLYYCKAGSSSMSPFIVKDKADDRAMFVGADETMRTSGTPGPGAWVELWSCSPRGSSDQSQQHDTAPQALQAVYRVGRSEVRWCSLRSASFLAGGGSSHWRSRAESGYQRQNGGRDGRLSNFIIAIAGNNRIACD